MRCLVCHGSGLHAVPKFALASYSRPYKVFVPEDDGCPNCGGSGKSGVAETSANAKQYPEDMREYLGTVVSYHSGSNAAILQLDSALRCGERIVVVEESEEHEIEVEWMQWGKAWVHLALRGWMVTIPSPESLSAGAKVYRAMI